MAPERPAEASPTGLGPVVDPGSVAERELVAAILRKDRKATARFVADYTDGVYAYVRHRLAPRADLVDDVVQEVFLAALGNLSSFLGNAPLRSWLLGVARHKVESFYRQQLREPEPLPDGGDAFEPTAGGGVDRRANRPRAIGSEDATDSEAAAGVLQCRVVVALLGESQRPGHGRGNGQDRESYRAAACACSGAV